MSSQVLTARTLLLRFLELEGLTPKLSDWNERTLAFNLPRLVRLQQLQALFRAFQIPWNPPAFTRGEFIQPESRKYDVPFSQLAEKMPEGRSGPFAAERRQLPNFFAILFDYRRRVNRLLMYGSGVLAASGLNMLAYRRALDLNDVIGQNIGIIDDLLVALISPDGATFSVDQLVRDYGYSEEDLDDLDIKYL